MSYLLLVDTAIQGVAVGLSPLSGDRAGELTWSEVIDAVGDSARLLPIAVDNGLLQCGIATTDIAGIVITTGPGSFTGLRVGLAYAMGFAAGVESISQTPMRWLGLSSLEVLANYHAKAMDDAAIFVTLAATKTNGYAAYARKNGESPELRTIQVSDDFASHCDDAVIGIGDWPLLEQSWPKKDKIFKVSSGDACFLTLTCYAELGLSKWPTGFKSSMPAPNYLRKSTVEEKELESQRTK